VCFLSVCSVRLAAGKQQITDKGFVCAFLFQFYELYRISGIYQIHHWYPEWHLGKSKTGIISYTNLFISN
jgi:hypothetical protein